MTDLSFHRAAVDYVRGLMPSGSCDSSRRCPLCCWLPDGGHLLSRCEAHEHIHRLEESNTAWRESQRIWHHCIHGFRTYPTALCSSARHDPGDNFEAVERMRELEAEVATLRAENERLRAHEPDPGDHA